MTRTGAMAAMTASSTTPAISAALARAAAQLPFSALLPARRRAPPLLLMPRISQFLFVYFVSLVLYVLSNVFFSANCVASCSFFYINQYKKNLLKPRPTGCINKGGKREIQYSTRCSYTAVSLESNAFTKEI